MNPRSQGIEIVKMRKTMTDKESITQIDHETVMGKIIYLSNKEERKGQERGRERG